MHSLRQTLRGRDIRKKEGRKRKGKRGERTDYFPRGGKYGKKNRADTRSTTAVPAINEKRHHEEGRILSDFFLITITIAEEVKTTRDSGASQLRAKDSRSVSASEQTRLMSAISCSPHR